MQDSSPESYWKPHYRDFEDYWIAYLKAHSRPLTRACHYLATAQGVGFGVVALLTRNPWWLLPAFGCGYALAVGSHFVVEKNRPLVHRPLWGWRSDFRMCLLALSGRLHQEYERHGLLPGAPDGAADAGPKSQSPAREA